MNKLNLFKKEFNILIIIGILIISLLPVTAVNTIVVPVKYVPTQTTTPLQTNTQVNVSNTNIINITNNITNYVYTTNNITNNFTSIINITNDNYITNNVTTYVINNVTNNLTNYVTFFSYQNFTYNITNDNYITNNITTYVNVTNDNYITNNFTSIINLTNDNYITNNITTYVNVTNDNYITNNITNYVITNVTNDIINNVTTFIVNNVTTFVENNITFQYNDTYVLYLISQLDSELQNEIDARISIGNWSEDKPNYNTTIELESYFDTLYYSISNPLLFINASVSSMTYFYNKSDIDSLLSFKLNESDERYNDTSYIDSQLQNYYNSTQINSSFYPLNSNPNNYSVFNGTTNYITMFGTNNTLINSPIVQNNLDNETTLEFFDDIFYIDITNEMVGINIVKGEENHAQSLTVGSHMENQSGTLSSTGYNIEEDSTNITLTGSTFNEYIVDAGQIRIGNNYYYVFEVLSDTELSVLGNHSITNQNWAYKQAPYIDVNGQINEERGYTISSNGTWMWALYTPHDSNDGEFCIQNRNAWFGGQTDALCISEDGSVDINGKLLADGYYIEVYNSTDSTLTMTTQNIWYNFTGWELGENSGWYQSGNIIVCNQSGLYDINYGGNFEINNNDDASFRLVINNVVDNRSLTQVRFTSNNPLIFRVPYLKRFEVGDTVYLQVQDNTRNGAVITSHQRNLRTTRIGN